jgi:hypothetical protein
VDDYDLLPIVLGLLLLAIAFLFVQAVLFWLKERAELRLKALREQARHEEEKRKLNERIEHWPNPVTGEGHHPVEECEARGCGASVVDINEHPDKTRRER